MRRTSKTEFLRGLGEYNPGAHGPSGTSSERQRLKEKIAAYDAQRGGVWNYEDLYHILTMILKGYPVDKARDTIAALDGPGEAAAKLGLFDGICGYIPIGKANFIERERRAIAFGKHEVDISPDFSFKANQEIFEVFIYPYKSPPLKQQQRHAIVNAIAATERKVPHFLILAEYPELSGIRKFRAETFDFRYRVTEEGFIKHMETFYDILDERSKTGDLFGG